MNPTKKKRQQQTLWMRKNTKHRINVYLKGLLNLSKNHSYWFYIEIPLIKQMKRGNKLTWPSNS